MNALAFHRSSCFRCHFQPDFFQLTFCRDKGSLFRIKCPNFFVCYIFQILPFLSGFLIRDFADICLLWNGSFPHSILNTLLNDLLRQIFCLLPFGIFFYIFRRYRNIFFIQKFRCFFGAVISLHPIFFQYMVNLWLHFFIRSPLLRHRRHGSHTGTISDCCRCQIRFLLYVIFYRFVTKFRSPCRHLRRKFDLRLQFIGKFLLFFFLFYLLTQRLRIGFTLRLYLFYRPLQCRVDVLFQNCPFILDIFGILAIDTLADKVCRIKIIFRKILRHITHDLILSCASIYHIGVHFLLYRTILCIFNSIIGNAAVPGNLYRRPAFLCIRGVFKVNGNLVWIDHHGFLTHFRFL